MNVTTNKKITILVVLLVHIMLVFVFFRYKPRAFFISGDSMFPKYRIGDLIIVFPQPVYSVGDVVAYKMSNSTQKFITHRIVEKSSLNAVEYYYTKGINSAYKDPLPVSNGDIVGKVSFSIPYIGSILKVLLHPILLGFLFYIPGGLWVGRRLAKASINAF